MTPCAAKPADQLHEIALAAVVFEWLAIVWRSVALDDEFILSPCMVTTEDFHEFRVNRNVVLRFPALGPEVFSGRNVNDALVPAERGPGELVDFVAP